MIWEHTLFDGTCLRVEKHVLPMVEVFGWEYIIRIYHNDRWLPLARVTNKLSVIDDFREHVGRTDIFIPLHMVGLVQAIAEFETVDDVMSS